MQMMPQSSNDQGAISSNSDSWKRIRSSKQESSNVESSNAKGWKWPSIFKSSNAKSSNEVRSDANEVVIGDDYNANDAGYNTNETEPDYNANDAGSNAKKSFSNQLASVCHAIATVFEWVVTFRWIVVIARWLIATAGNVGESAFLVSTVWVTIEIMAPTLVKWILPDNIVSLANQMAVIAFTVLPELIIWTALATSYEHWKLAASSKRLDEGLWAFAYSVPTAAFLVMTVVTLTSFVSLEALGKGAPQATGWWLVIRCMAGWIYGTVSILYSKGGGKRITTILENQTATIKVLGSKLQQHSSNILALQKEKLELQQLLDASKKEVLAARLQLSSGKVLTSGQRQDAITMLEVANNIETVIAKDTGSNNQSSNANEGLQSSNANDYNANVSGSNYNGADTNSISIPIGSGSNSSSNNSNGKKVTTLKSSNANARNTDAISNPVLKKSSKSSNTTPMKQTLKDAVAKNAKDGSNKNFKTIASEAGVPYSTANLYKKEVYAELQQENENA